MIEKPQGIFDRSFEWKDLNNFIFNGSPGLQIGIVRGRRRNGKSFLLEHLCKSTNGVYTLALRQTQTQALARFTDTIGAELGHPIEPAADWIEALDLAVDSLLQITPTGQVPVLVIDEFPYLIAHSPELPSVIQALYDQRGPSKNHPTFKLILCGSSAAFMGRILAGDQPLFGRAVIDMRINPFLYRDSAVYWGCDPMRAFLINATVGGSPGYRDAISARPDDGDDGFYQWLEQSVLNPSHILFTEPDYLLAEDPRISDHTIYHAIWEAVSRGATTPTQIAGLVGMAVPLLNPYLAIMKDGGFLHFGEDLLLQRRPIITVADPIVRFHNLIVRPNEAELSLRETREVWDRSRDTFSAKILGPHFEELAREWVRWYASEVGLDNIGRIGTTEVPCQEHRGHEIDVIALDRYAMPRNKNARITLLGEAKATNAPRTIADLGRLEHIRALFVDQGRDASNAELALFSRSGFDADLIAESRNKAVHLLDLADLYGSR